MRTHIDQLGDGAHAWVFGISPALDAEQQQRLLGRIDAFLDDWAAHGIPIAGASEVREGSFLVIAADENREKSGCSIDRMFGTLRELERELGAKILDANRVFLRENGGIRTVARADLRNVANGETIVFDTTAERLGEIRSGSWERRAADSWHRALLGER